MKFTLNWLKEHLDTNASLDEIVTKLTDIGLEVEDVQDRAAIYSQFKLVEIEHAEKHPNADRLKVCRVKSESGIIQIVCGAPNARTGLKAFHAGEGTVIPTNGMVMKKSKIRDVESNGMMVSLSEMGLSDESDGIIEAASDLAIGTTIAQALGLDDPVIEINLTPNRPDCAGVRGIARDLAAAGLGTLKPLQDAETVTGKFKSEISVTIADEAKEACPVFFGRMIRNVINTHEKECRFLKGIGQKPISALVDITNFMSIDLCRPLHVFDADKIKGNITVRLSKKGESLAALNGKTYELQDGMTVVCDDTGVIGLAGVIGGESTAVSTDTKNVFLEVAYFDPYRTAKTGRALGINSDARYRFERGVDPQFTSDAVDIATNHIFNLCGGEASETVQAGEIPAWTREITWRKDAASKLLGFEIEFETQKKILNDLGFTIHDGKVTPPSWRPDIEGEADLVEEIARIYGFDKIPAQSVTRDGAIAKPAETQTGARIRKIRNALGTNGLQECVTWSFMSSPLAAKFGGTAAGLRLVNPISSDLDQMRPSILPNLIEAAQRNENKGLGGSALFEVGPAFFGTDLQDQKMMASGIRSGLSGARHWSGADISRPVDAFDAKADALRILEACGTPSNNVQITRDAPGYYHPGRSGALRLGQTVLGYFGELHPSVLKDMDVKIAIAGFEVFIEALTEPKKKGNATALPPLKLAELQPISRDFAFLADKSVDADAFVRAIKLVDRELITDVSVFDIYTGKGVEDGMKSVALSVTLQPKKQTLTDADIEGLSKKIVDAVQQKTSASLRG